MDVEKKDIKKAKEFQDTMRRAEKTMERYDDVFRKLAEGEPEEEEKADEKRR